MADSTDEKKRSSDEMDTTPEIDDRKIPRLISPRRGDDDAILDMEKILEIEKDTWPQIPEVLDIDLDLLKEVTGEEVPPWAIPLALAVNKSNRNYILNVNRYLEFMHDKFLDLNTQYKGMSEELTSTKDENRILKNRLAKVELENGKEKRKPL